MLIKDIFSPFQQEHSLLSLYTVKHLGWPVGLLNLYIVNFHNPVVVIATDHTAKNRSKGKYCNLSSLHVNTLITNQE